MQKRVFRHMRTVTLQKHDYRYLKKKKKKKARKRYNFKKWYMYDQAGKWKFKTEKEGKTGTKTCKNYIHSPFLRENISYIMRSIANHF